MAVLHYDRRVAVVLMCLVCLLSACRRQAQTRTTDEIFREQLELPVLYLTAETGQRVIAPGSRGIFVHEPNGEICWPALACHNPACPGRTTAGEPCLFVAADPSVVVKEDGSLGSDSNRSAAASEPVEMCPKCLQIRNRQAETSDEAQQYADWVRPHVLPKTAERLAELDEERRRIHEQYEERMNRPMPED